MDTTLQDPLIGQVLDERYRIDALIAVGGMATVYRALDTRLDRVLAVKVMHPALAADASFVERFIREAKSVARLSHPNVVGVHDQGRDGAYVYLAMEYVAGCTLRDVLRERVALQPRAALDILEPVLAALGAAHRAGFVHRDMKPENVLIGDDGRVKVADFGLVRSVDTVTSSTGAVLGTVSYLAPEQLEDGTAEPRVDVYACGVLLYEMLTGARPHSGDSPAQVLYRHLHEDVPPPSRLAPQLAAGLDRLVASATARTPGRRPKDAVALLAAVRETRAALTAEQLDAVPPAAGPEGADWLTAHDTRDDRTSVLPRSGRLTGTRPATGSRRARETDPEAELHRTSVLAPPPPGRPRGRGPRLRTPGRGPLAVLLAVLVILGAGTGIWYINSGQFTRVPPLLAKTEAQARQRLGQAGLEAGAVKRSYSATDKRGTVISTDPETGQRIRRHDRVALTISLGPRTVRVPDVDGEPLDRARTMLRSAGLAPGMVTRTFSEDIARGSVVRATPGSGTSQRAGTAVALEVSRGRPVDLPDVTGETPADAEAALKKAGLKVRTASGRVHSQFDAGRVAAQSPDSPRQLAAGDTVTLTLSKGPQMVPVPDVMGETVDTARARLSAAGFKVKVDRGLLGGLFGGDKVKSQSVDGGEKAPKGSEITVEVG
ncbi:Stk1 family PASTA domain-containing Ser/Thr kinase [Streptomyces sp. NPDC058045]|uniref:Stk1 family PASTA domain-containing Ser/Thr kinase n=1 Tax=Streptomyces sp. NPDC058045 TaxID=3346311 RepID=UPI0036E0F61C